MIRLLEAPCRFRPRTVFYARRSWTVVRRTGFTIWLRNEDGVVFRRTISELRAILRKCKQRGVLWISRPKSLR